MRAFAFFGLFLAATALQAQEPAPVPAPRPAPFTWHALVMSSYQYDTHDPAPGELAFRVFDRDQQSWRFNLAALSLSRPAAPFGFTLDLVTGDDAPVMASLGAPDPESVDFTQAFVALKPAALRGVELRAGKFLTMAGYEVIPAWDNVNMTQSRSYLFGYAIPFTHTGMRALVPLGGRATLVAGVNRGWDRWEDDNDALSTELALTVTPSSRWSLGINTYRGPEQADNQENVRQLVDLTATYVASDRLTLGFNADLASEEGASVATPGEDASWHGFALYARRAFSPSWALGVRMERFSDPDGARTGVAQDLSDLDLTLDWTAEPHLLLRGDLRFDRSTEAVFAQGGGDPATESRATLGFAIVYRR